AIYQLYGKPENVEMFFQDAPHNYNQAAREAVYAFFGKTVLGLNDPVKERPIRMEQPSLMLALFNRKLPDNALDLAGLFEEWKRIGLGTASSVTDRGQMREMLEYTLGTEWPARVLSETHGDTFVLSREGR